MFYNFNPMSGCFQPKSCNSRLLPVVALFFFALRRPTNLPSPQRIYAYTAFYKTQHDQADDIDRRLYLFATERISGTAAVGSFLQTAGVWSHVRDKSPSVEDFTAEKSVELVFMSVLSHVFKTG